MLTTVTRKLKRAKSLLRAWVVDDFFGEVPRLLFGNDAGFYNNVGPLATRTVAASPAKRTVPQTVRSEVDCLKQDGFVACQPAYDSETVRALISKFQSAVQDSVHARPNSKYSVELKDPMGSIPEFAALLNPRMGTMLEEYFGSPFRVVETQAFRTYPIPECDLEKDAYSNVWHCDGYPVSWLKVYVLLSNWDATSGGTQILPIRSTKRIMRAGYVNRHFFLRGKERLARLTADHITATGAAGSAFVFNPQRCLHRAGVPKAGGHRDAMMFFVAGCSGRSTDAWGAR